MKKYIKTFENYSNDDNNKIEIRTGSHSSNRDINKKAFSKLNNLLLSKENPHFDLFNEEELYLDDVDGIVSIVPSSHIYKVNPDVASEINDFILDNLTNNVWVYIGPYIFRN